VVDFGPFRYLGIGRLEVHDVYVRRPDRRPAPGLDPSAEVDHGHLREVRKLRHQHDPPPPPTAGGQRIRQRDSYTISHVRFIALPMGQNGRRSPLG
jgi:hypothetical protein